MPSVFITGTGGNPQFAKIVLASGHPEQFKPSQNRDVPQQLQYAVKRRLEAIPKQVRPLLRIAAAAMDQQFSLETLQKLTGRPTRALLTALKHATEAGILTETNKVGGEFRFAFEAFQWVLSEELSVDERVALALKHLEILEREADGSERYELDLRATLSFRALPHGSPDKAFEYAMRAGEDALVINAPARGRQRFENAVQIADRFFADDFARRVRARIMLGAAEGQANDGASAYRSFDEARRFALRADLPDLFAMAVLGLSFSGHLGWGVPERLAHRSSSRGVGRSRLRSQLAARAPAGSSVWHRALLLPKRRTA